MFARGDARAEIIDVRRDQAVLRADELVIEPNARDPADPLQKQRHTLSLPGGGNLDLALIPGWPGVVVKPVGPRQRWRGGVLRAESRLVNGSGQMDLSHQLAREGRLIRAGDFKAPLAR